MAANSFMFFPHRLLSLLALFCAGSIMAAPLEPPVDGILDDTHALTKEAHEMLATKISDFRKEQEYDVWLVTTTFLESNKTVRHFSRDLRKSWSGSADAILLAYDRGTDRSAISLSPGIWNRYSASALTNLLQVGGGIMSDSTKTPEQRITDFTGKLLRGMRDIRREQAKMDQSLSRDHRRLAGAFAGACGLGALGLFVLGIRSRRQDIQAALQTHLPEIQVGTRLGAPFGGGVAVIWTDEKKLEMTFE